jgi:steroid 5-alpha reductase family enzyme
MEVISDAQLQRFRDDPERDPKAVLDTGLYRISRHPNYFGECLLWWGIYFIACGQTNSQGYWTFYSALFITFLIRFVSGVKMLEVKQKKKAGFRVYM